MKLPFLSLDFLELVSSNFSHFQEETKLSEQAHEIVQGVISKVKNVSLNVKFVICCVFAKTVENIRLLVYILLAPVTCFIILIRFNKSCHRTARSTASDLCQT